MKKLFAASQHRMLIITYYTVSYSITQYVFRYTRRPRYNEILGRSKIIVKGAFSNFVKTVIDCTSLYNGVTVYKLNFFVF